MPDYAGAKAAIRAYAAANWTATSRIEDARNKNPAQPWPPVDGAGALVPFVAVEVLSAGPPDERFGLPGASVMTYEGWIKGHVYVPVATQTADAEALAWQFGEMFRNKRLYNATPDFEVRTLTPYTDAGGDGDDDGVWFRVTATIPFEYWHRG